MSLQQTAALLPLFGGVVFFSWLSGLIIVLAFEFRQLSTGTGRDNIGSLSILMLALAVIGTTAGLSGGMSRIGVVGDIYPAALTFVGAGAAYLFGIDRTRGTIVSVCAIVFTIGLFFGYSAGADRRNVGDETRALRKVCLDALTDGDFATNEAAFNRFWSLMQADQVLSEKQKGQLTAQGVNPDDPKLIEKLFPHPCASMVRTWSLR
tara:strand:+ start:16291 stop:16911 length:621 start_codon:yes stop_codon:yes gene_type:complete